MSDIEPDEDATIISPRRAAPDDDATVLSTRGDLDDATQLASHTAAKPAAVRARRTGALPPGEAPPVDVERGHFGEDPSAYTPRPVPTPSAVEVPDPTPVEGLRRPATSVPEPQRRRESRRHRRLIITALVVALAAALLTAAAVGVVALARSL